MFGSIFGSDNGYIGYAVAALIGFGFGWAIYAHYRRRHLRNAPIRKEKAQQEFFITTMKKVVEAMTSHLEWEQNHGSCHRENGAAYQSSWVDLGLATHGNDEWLFRYNAGDAKPECLTDSEWEQFTALIVKFGRATVNGGVEAWVKRYHEDGSHEIQPYANDHKPVNPDAVMV